MKKIDSNMKIYPSFKNMLLVILSAGGVIILFTVLFTILSNYITTMNTGNITLFYLGDLILPGILVCITIFFIIFTRFRSYYVFTPNGLVFQKYTKKVFYPYKEIIYIDDVRSRKENKVYIYMVSGSEAILSGDTNKVLLSQLLFRCENMLSRNDFLRKYPNKRLTETKSKSDK